MARTALVTGASTGIGMEFAGVFAREGYDLFLVGRGGERLAQVRDALAGAYGIAATYLEMDLSVVGAPEALVEALDAQGVTIDVLVNNAGVGVWGKFLDNDVERLRGMLRINVLVPTLLARLLGARMAERGQGAILNVASVSGFLPGPWMAAYHASKAYVVSFSEALATELRGSGVMVTALCPGPVMTDFMEESGMIKSRIARGKKLASAKSIAEYGYRAMKKGKRVAVPGLKAKAAVFLRRFLPERTQAWVMERLLQPAKKEAPKVLKA